MDSAESLPELSPLRRFAFATAGYGAGFLGVIAWGWIAGAVFLLTGGGDIGDPVLPFMVLWASLIAAPGAFLALFMWITDRRRCRQAPWSWMQRIIWTATLTCAAGWLGVWLEL